MVTKLLRQKTQQTIPGDLSGNLSLHKGRWGTSTKKHIFHLDKAWSVTGEAGNAGCRSIPSAYFIAQGISLECGSLIRERKVLDLGSVTHFPYLTWVLYQKTEPSTQLFWISPISARQTPLLYFFIYCYRYSGFAPRLKHVLNHRKHMWCGVGKGNVVRKEMLKRMPGTCKFWVLMVRRWMDSTVEHWGKGINGLVWQASWKHAMIKLGQKEMTILAA